MCAETVCLAIRLEGPLQAWGSASQYNRRLTDLLPSRSAVTGMLCAALGLGRGSTEETDFLREMTGVRMLAVAVVRGIAVEPIGPPGIGHHRRSELRPVGGIDDEAPHGIAPEIDAQKIVGSRLHSYFD